ncbi:SURF1 family protein [Pseudomonas sp. SZMC_28357]|uniref:SURF1 family protein n=1 Tax=Pseudomonas sp. SZMC_28357 TaxID=3074380 RepID=UPI0028715D53|nr:SURF1 family protein [Pseudomonas sp. SZMC_28357]MDR9751254.1 SURF1 family protein [Pseudomonas sp. SZMC_28357]
MKGFRPGVVPTLAVALLLPLLVCLGFWQLSRGAEKTALLNAYAERRAAEPMASIELPHTQDPAFRRVRLHGQFDGEHSLLLDNRQRNGKVGVELLQPFLDQASGLWLLVNRGWLPWPDRRTPAQFSTPKQALALDAWVYVAPGATFQLHADPATSTWPQLVTAVDPAKLWSSLGREGFAYELRAEGGPTAYLADWPVVAMGPEKHLAYAVQWFALAIALFGLYLYLGWHNAKEKHHGSGHESTQHV